MEKLRFGIIATGTIAARLVKAMRTTATCVPVAAASRSAEKARAFADEFSLDPVTGYDALLERDDIDAVYIATPHPQHHEWCLKAIAAGKHVLCEKPMTMTLAQADEIIRAATHKGVLFVEAFMYRFHPQNRRIADLVAKGEIGEVHWINADFGFELAYNPAHRLFANALGGGAILDLGCYPVSMARMIAGAANGQAFLNPTSIQATGLLNPEESTDSLSGAILQFRGDLLATVRCSTRFNLGCMVRIEGTAGTIEINSPWFAGSEGASIVVKKPNEKIILETVDATDLYSFMLDEFATCWSVGKKESAVMSHADSLGNMQVLEEWYRQVGVIYR